MKNITLSIILAQSQTLTLIPEPDYRYEHKYETLM